MKSKYLFMVLEVVWIAIAIIALAGGIRSLTEGIYNRAVIFFLMVPVALAFARFRHSQRKKL